MCVCCVVCVCVCVLFLIKDDSDDDNHDHDNNNDSFKFDLEVILQSIIGKKIEQQIRTKNIASHMRYPPILACRTD